MNNKILINTLLVMVAGVANVAATAATDSNTQCPAAQLIADYEMNVSDGEHTQHAHLTLVRKGDDVIQQTEGEPVSMWWHKTRDNRLALTRLFDSEAHAIEYQPADIKNGKGLAEWEQKYQLLPMAVLESMTKVAVSGEGCARKETYQQKTADDTLTVEWLPEQQLVSAYVYQKGSHTVHWTLRDTRFDRQAVEAIYAAKSVYQTVDYADIGDNESDPFIRKMIKLGFVEHGASGFYHADGSSLEGGHHH